jgi:hypothetical protein
MRRAQRRRPNAYRRGYTKQWLQISRAVEPPPPLELITEDDVGVTCWMIVLPG